MRYESITYEVDERVAIITFNRPAKLNAFNQGVKDETRDAVRRFDQDSDRRVLIITGAGDKAFSAGYDLQEATSTPRTDIEKWRGRLHDDYTFTRAPWECSKPVIAMINGHCLAGALEFAQMCDIRYASDDSTFGVVETRFSAGIVTFAMPWIIGNRCRELIYTGDTIDAGEAVRLGLINRAFPKAHLRSEVLKIAHRMSQVAMACLTWNKRTVRHTYETMGFDAAMQYGFEAATILDTTHTPEFVDFARVRSDQGLGAALKWRDDQFRRYE